MFRLLRFGRSPYGKCLRRYKVQMLILITLCGLVYFYYAVNGEHLRQSCDISEAKLDNLRLLIKTVANALEKEKVRYWLDYGSLLGSYRCVY